MIYKWLFHFSSGLIVVVVDLIIFGNHDDALHSNSTDCLIFFIKINFTVTGIWYCFVNKDLVSVKQSFSVDTKNNA